MAELLTDPGRRLRLVQPRHLEEMARRLADAARDRAYAVVEGPANLDDDPAYLRARDRHERRLKTLARLTRALERQMDGDAA